MENTLALIDIGSQTFRMVIISLNAYDFNIKLKITKDVQLAEDLKKNGLINERAIERGIKALNEYKEHIIFNNVKKIIAVATHPLRVAKNSLYFIKKCQEMGIEIEVLSSYQEAEIAARGALYSLSKNSGVIMDIGGGSTELIKIKGHKKSNFISIPIGAVFLKDFFCDNSCCHGKKGYEMENYFEFSFNEMIRDYMESFSNFCMSSRESEFIAIGGAATTLSFILSGMKQYDPRFIRGTNLSKIEIMSLWNELLNLSDDEISEKFGINPVRSSVIHSGMFILKKIFDFLAIDKVIISDAGLLMGLVIKYFKEEYPHAKLPRPDSIYI